MNPTRIHTIELKNLNFRMVEIPKGNVHLNDDRTKQKWSVNIAPFLMAEYPVTQELYLEVMRKNPSDFQGNRLPVESITWLDAVTFCNQLSELQGLTPCYTFSEDSNIHFDQTQNGFRLPTEAEWQYACQAGTSAIRYGDLKEIAWFKENAERKTQEVGRKQPNAWGLYDMLGNVWEWCSDIYDEDVYGSYRIFRGGGWCDEARSVMATTRRRSHPRKFQIDDLGFRISRNNPGPEDPK